MTRKAASDTGPAADGFRPGNFPSLKASLDYAARSGRGMTFYDSRGDVRRVVTYAQLRSEALAAARRLLGLGLAPGDRVAVLAETRAEFMVVFYACQYAGLVPVPLPAVVNLGGRDAYLRQLTFFLENCGAIAAFATEEFLSFLVAGSGDLEMVFVGQLDDLAANPMVAESELPEGEPHDIAYVQYTSGSTRVARGAVISCR